MNIKRFLTYGNFFLFFSSFFVSLSLTFLVLTLLCPDLFFAKKVNPIVAVAPLINSEQQLLIKGSIPYWDQENAVNSFRDHIDKFSYVNLFWYYLGTDGSVVKYEYAKEDFDIIALAHSNHVKVSAVITNLPEFPGASWDTKRVEDAINDPSRRVEHIRNIVKTITDLQLDGVVIDYESVNSSARNSYSIFIRDLSQALHKKNKELAVVLHPKTDDWDKKGNGGFQDWKALSESVDQLQIMGYGEHWDTSEAGPIASTQWIKKILAYAKNLEIPERKIFLGIPLYGYDWDMLDNSSANDLTFSGVQKLLSDYTVKDKWDPFSESPYFTYQKGSQNHEVWFENARSISKKIEIAKNAGLEGVTFWRLGQEDPALWNQIEKYR